MLEIQIMKAWRDYENSNYMNTKALNKYLKLTELVRKTKLILLIYTDWRDIEGYENRYQISSLGRVKSLGNSKNRKDK